jgi:hypothetical protein
MNMQATPAVAPPPTATPRPPRHRFRSWLLGSLFGAVLLIAIYTMAMLWYSYSDGERAGVLQKFSSRGWVCKTYEGELALYVVGGVAPQIWHFSVRDEAVAERLHTAVGQQIRLRYAEHRGLPTSCFGETDYFATDFEVIAAAAPVAPGSALAVEPAAPPAGPPGAQP